MGTPNATPWVDETGVGDGTLFSAQRMNNIEQAIAALSPVPTLVANGDTFTVKANTQVLYAVPIDVQGGIDLSGHLVEVS